MANLNYHHYLAIAAILLLVVPAVGMIVGMTVLASEPADEPTATATPDPANAPSPEPGGPSDQRTVYTYEDGGRTMRVVLQSGLAVRKSSAVALDDDLVVKGPVESIVKKRAGHGQDAPPVFRSESGGGLMTLPGGVLLALDPEWDQAKVESFFAANAISMDEVSGLEFMPNGFFVETEPGFPSLELANDLAAQDGVVISGPNWWREIEAK